MLFSMLGKSTNSQNCTGDLMMPHRVIFFHSQPTFHNALDNTNSIMTYRYRCPICVGHVLPGLTIVTVCYLVLCYPLVEILTALSDDSSDVHGSCQVGLNPVVGASTSGTPTIACSTKCFYKETIYIWICTPDVGSHSC